eukprot:SAG31_NODE_3262_length_4482_cov_8.132101_4_plen_50_part_00
MFGELRAEMASAGWGGLSTVEAEWQEAYMTRRIISEFMKDPLLVCLIQR